MKLHARKICLSLASTYTLLGSLVSIGLTSIACTDTSESHQSNSTQITIPLADLQAQANHIDNIDDAVQFMNQTLQDIIVLIYSKMI